jgi:hypothetical protein
MSAVRRARRLLPICPLLALVLAGCSGAISVPAASSTQRPGLTTPVLLETPAQADNLVNSVGVDTHFNYPTTPYATQFPIVSAALIASGIRHIRDGSISFTPPYSTMLQTLGAAGIMHSVGFDTNVTPAQITQALAAQAPYVESVEPANEWDGSAGSNPGWLQQLLAEQSLLYATVRSNPLNANLVVLGPPLAHQNLYALLGNLNAVSDAGNLHNATCNLNPGTTTNLGIPTMTAYLRLSTSKPIWTTETGYGDDTTRPCALPDAVIAKYDPREVGERFLAGEPRTEFYQFTDMPSDKVFGSMGLTFASGAPKAQYLALASMLHLLSDKGSAFSPQPLSYSISGATSNLHHLLLQKRDGTYFLLLWLEVPSWKPLNATNVGGSALVVSPQSVTVTCTSAHASATLFNYASTQSLASTALSSSTSSYTFPVSDSIAYLSFK